MLVETVTKYDSNFFSVMRSVQKLCETITPNDRLYENYKHRLNLTDAVAISTYKQFTDIVGFSTVLCLPEYGNGVRVLNRFYKDPKYRQQGTKLTVETKTMVSQQLDAAEKLNYDYAFMSRESNTNQFAMKHFVKQLDSQWIVMPNKYHVAKNNRQHVAVYPLTDCWKAALNLRESTE